MPIMRKASSRKELQINLEKIGAKLEEILRHPTWAEMEESGLKVGLYTGFISSIPSKSGYTDEDYKIFNAITRIESSILILQGFMSSAKNIIRDYDDKEQKKLRTRKIIENLNIITFSGDTLNKIEDLIKKENNYAVRNPKKETQVK